MTTLPILDSFKQLIDKAFDFSSPFVIAIWVIIILGSFFAIANVIISSRKR